MQLRGPVSDRGLSNFAEDSCNTDVVSGLRNARRSFHRRAQENGVTAPALMTDVANAVGVGNVRGSLERRHVDYVAAQRPTSANGKITGPELTLMSATNARRVPAPVLPTGHAQSGKHRIMLNSVYP